MCSAFSCSIFFQFVLGPEFDFQYERNLDNVEKCACEFD